MNFNRRRRSVLLFWWLLTVIVLVIEGQVDHQFAPKQSNGPGLDINQSDQHSDGMFNQMYDKHRGPWVQRQFSSETDLVGRMGNELMIGLQDLKSRIISNNNRDSYGASDYSSSGGYEEGCCSKLDYHTFLPGFVLVAISYFLLFLLNATVTGGRRRRMATSSKIEEECKLNCKLNYK